MSPTATQILAAALALDDADRADVAGALLESLEAAGDPDAETVWSEEIRRRLAALDSGEVRTVAWSEVRERLFRGYE